MFDKRYLVILNFHDIFPDLLEIIDYENRNRW